MTGLRKTSIPLGLVVVGIIAYSVLLPRVAAQSNATNQGKGDIPKVVPQATQSDIFADMPKPSESEGINKPPEGEKDGTADYFWSTGGNESCQIMFVGDDEYDNAGDAIAVGDVNGDGDEDLIFSASYADGPDDTLLEAGEIYIFYGPLNAWGSTVFASEADVIIYGSDSADFAGETIAVGDINGDNIADIIIGSPWGDGRDNLTKSTGDLYILFGSPELQPIIDLATDADVIIYGKSSSLGEFANQTGHDIDLGDFNGDELLDIMTYSPGGDGPGDIPLDCGVVYVLYGRLVWPSEMDLDTDYDIVLWGPEPYDGYINLEGINHRLWNCQGAGDINLDGYDDLLIGFPGGDGPLNLTDQAGEVRIVYGGPSLPDSIDLSTQMDVVIWGSNFEDMTARVNSFDFNGDGGDDLVLVVRGDGPLEFKMNAGQTSIILGSASLPDTIFLESDEDVIIYGREFQDGMYYAAAAVDMDNNGSNEVLFSAGFGDGPFNSLTSCGEAYYLRSPDTLAAVVDLAVETVDATIFGSEAFERLGLFMIVGGDLDGNAGDELIFGALAASYGGFQFTGRVYILNSSAFLNNDTDQDYVDDLCDNCPDNFDPDQKDIDGDGIGDVCDDTNELVVTTLDDAGDGSLRWAMQYANSTITFDVSGTISLVTALPVLLDSSIFILGSTAPDGIHSVVLDGSALLSGNGLYVSGFGNYIEGLTITNFPFSGILVGGLPGSDKYNTFTQNLIYNNTRLAIDLGDDGVTLNDPGDADIGPNNLLNYPEVDSIYSQEDGTYVIYGTADIYSTVELFLAHPAEDTLQLPDPSGHGEAYKFLGSTNASPTGKFSLPTDISIEHFSILSATATDTMGNTSEMSVNFVLLPRPITVTTYGPVNIIITDPDGFRFGLEADGTPITEIADAEYFNNPFDPEISDSCVINYPIIGTYQIEIVAETAKDPMISYSAAIRIDGTLQFWWAVNQTVPSAGVPATFNYEYEEGYAYENGNANGDDATNVGDAVFLINYVFKGGPAPDPVLAGDANCDAGVNVGDAVYIINYVFKGGPAPCLFIE